MSIPRVQISKILTQLAGAQQLIGSGVPTVEAFSGIDHYFNEWNQVQNFKTITDPLFPIISQARLIPGCEIPHTEALEALSKSVSAVRALAVDYSDLSLMASNLFRDIELLLGLKTGIPKPQDSILAAGTHVFGKRRTTEEVRIANVQREAVERSASHIAKNAKGSLAQVGALLDHLTDYVSPEHRKDLDGARRKLEVVREQIRKFQYLSLGEETEGPQNGQPQQPAPLASAIEAYKTDVSGSTPLHILVLDSQESRIKRVKEMLDFVRHERVYHAGDVDLAFEILQREPINLLILNKNVSGWSAFDLAEWLLGANPNLKIIIQADGLEGKSLEVPKAKVACVYEPLETVKYQQFAEVLKSLFTAAA